MILTRGGGARIPVIPQATDVLTDASIVTSIDALVGALVTESKDGSVYTATDGTSTLNFQVTVPAGTSFPSSSLQNGSPFFLTTATGNYAAGLYLYKDGTWIGGSGGGSGVTSLQSLIGAITLASPDNSVQIITSGNTIRLSTSGGTTTWYEYPIDIPPTTPSAYDDEFTAGALNSSKWTVLNATPADTNRSASVIPSGPGYLVLDSPYTTTDRYYGIYQTAPSGAFTMTAKVALDGFTDSYNGVMLDLFSTTTATTAKIKRMGLIFNPVGDAYLQTDVYNMTNYTTYVTDSPCGPYFNTTAYLRWIYDGTNLTALISATGNFGSSSSASVFFTETAATFLGGAPALIGLSLHPYAIKTRAVIDWFRVTQP